MKIFIRILIGVFTLLLLIFVFTYFWLKGTAPNYSGQLEKEDIQEEVEIIFNDFGVPHIYAQNAHDAYFALGYAHAQERLFQMEMIRRATSGRLSEVLGEALLPTDKIMLTLSIRKAAEKSAKKAFQQIDSEYQKQSLAYLEGINSFIDEGNLPIEFYLIGFEPEHFTPEDIYTAIGYMSLSFTTAIYLDPIMTNIYKTLGEKYLIDLSIDSISNSNHYNDEDAAVLSEILYPKPLQEYLPVPIWEASNNWVMSKDRSASSKVLLANDTHIAYSQPSVWYEAHLNYPGFEMFGFYLAGVPFALIGHNHNFGWGLTIFPFDNMDLYREKVNPANKNQYWHSGTWNNFGTQSHKIKVKDSEDVDFIIPTTVHGPILNQAYTSISSLESSPISLWWSLHHLETTALEALYEINNSNDIISFEKSVELVDIVGLNIVYGDMDDNIAWWATGKIPVRNSSINPKLILDGSDTANDFKGFYPFAKNPKLINPEDGLIVTANDAPIRVDGILYPGYYYTGYRTNRIKTIVNSQNLWTLEGMKRIQNDVKSDRDLRIRDLIFRSVDIAQIKSEGQTQSQAVEQLLRWDGEYSTSSIAPTVYTSIIFHLLQQTTMDELGEQQFERLANSLTMKSSLEKLFFNENSPWWDNVETKEIVESRDDIFLSAVKLALNDLTENLGEDFNNWQWGKLHTLTHVHPIGRKEPFDKVFNVGPFADRGGNEIVIKEAHKYNGHGPYKVYSGPAMRLLLDFGKTDEALSIIPTGQSGNLMSEHYADQAEMFIEGEYKVQRLDKESINKKGSLKLIPKK